MKRALNLLKNTTKDVRASREVTTEIRLSSVVIYNCINSVRCTCGFTTSLYFYFGICLKFSVKKKKKERKKWKLRKRGYFTLRWGVLKKPFGKVQ